MLVLLVLLQDPGAIDHAAKTVRGMDVRKWAPVDDAAFLERVTRDLWGEAPADVPAFVADKTIDKRLRKVDERLASPKFAAHWGRRLSAALIGDPAGYRIDLVDIHPKAAGVAAAAFERWMTEGVAADRPWTDTVRAIIEARGELASVPELAWKLRFTETANGARGMAVSLAAGTLGVRLGCAVCHDHPYDRWTVGDVYGLGAFFIRDRARVHGDGLQVQLRVADQGELEIPRSPDANDRDAKVKLAQGGTADPVFLFGGMAGRNDDRLKALSGLMTAKANTQLPRAFVNRVWADLFGQGIVHPIDDFNLRNKAISPALLDSLTRGFVDGGYRLKPLLRSICSTQIYQNVDLTEPDKAEWSSLRGLVVNPPVAPKNPFNPFTLELPPSWTLVHRRSGYSTPFRVPAKDGKGSPAIFGVPNIGGDWPRQFPGAVPARETLGRVRLTDIMGAYTCAGDHGAPRENWRILDAELEGGKRVRLEGPAETVGAWKAEFVEMLKKAAKAP